MTAANVRSFAVSEAVLFGHLVGVLLFVAGIFVAGAAFESARRREQPAEVALLLGLSRSGVALVLGGGLLLLACGLWLVDLEDVGLGTGWVLAAIALFLLALSLGGLGGQGPKRARILATALAEEDKPMTPELRALLDAPLSRIANYTATGLIGVILALMVFKP
jgi:uncharacterized membrane protein